MTRTLTQIWIYPIKSLGGTALQSAKVEPRGLQYDRRWMLVNPEGQFMTQREIPQMALLSVAVEPPYLKVSWKHDPATFLHIPLESPSPAGRSKMVQVWGDRCRAIGMEKSINDWFSTQLKQDLQLVYMPDTTRRRADGRYAPKGHVVSFADGFPYLVLGQASLDALNQRLEQPVPMNRFRPNLVFTGGQAFEEDTWADFHIGEVPFRGVKPCGRCIIITTHQETAQRTAEPLKTLSVFRKNGNKVLFGQNTIWMGEGEQWVRLGDPIQP